MHPQHHAELVRRIAERTGHEGGLQASSAHLVNRTRPPLIRTHLYTTRISRLVVETFALFLMTRTLLPLHRGAFSCPRLLKLRVFVRLQ